MLFRDSLSTLLPAPRDDEPATLRQDIIDELSDHLACAYNRELLCGKNVDLAHQHVLDRFGDPAAVARRLWLDAMKGKIMAQRVLITSCLAVALACLSLVGLVYVQSNRAAAQAAEANRKLSQVLAEAQTTNNAMLSELTAMSEAIRNPRSLDWNPLKFKITDDTPDGPPLAGCSIHLYLKDSPQKQVARRPEASGIADFGLVNPGEYAYSVYVNHDRGGLVGNGELVVGPGSQINKEIICPKKALEPVPLYVRCEWPADLEKEGLIIDAPFRFIPIQKDGVSWSFNTGMGNPTHSVLLGPGAALQEVVNPTGLYLWASSMQINHADALTSDVRVINRQTEPLRWERGTYQLSELIVLRPRAPKASATGRLRFDVLVTCYPGHTSRTAYGFRQMAPTDEELRARGTDGMNPQMQVPGLALPKESWSKIITSFDARPDRANEWMITLPDELIRTARAAIKVERSAEGKPAITAPPADRN
jgi:hypothetical protein